MLLHEVIYDQNLSENLQKVSLLSSFDALLAFDTKMFFCLIKLHKNSAYYIIMLILAFFSLYWLAHRLGSSKCFLFMHHISSGQAQADHIHILLINFDIYSVPATESSNRMFSQANTKQHMMHSQIPIFHSVVFCCCSTKCYISLWTHTTCDDKIDGAHISHFGLVFCMNQTFALRTYMSFISSMEGALMMSWMLII
jgi:hypothetical protein